MFTGIVEAVAPVTAAAPLGKAGSPDGGGRRLTFAVPFADELGLGDSVAVNGACLTAVEIEPGGAGGRGTFAVDAVEETLRKTNLGTLQAGDHVNVERALAAGARLDGHFVQGHVDTTGRIEAVEPEETGRLYTIGFDAEAFAHYLIPTGSVALDGISLTVARLDRDAGTLTVAIIPHTYEATAIAERWAEGAAVNVEFDMIGKYVAGMTEAGGSGLDFDA